MTKSIPKKQQRIARFLLAVMVINLTSPYTVKAAVSNSKDNSDPVAAMANGMVDPFSGDLHYSVPLLSVFGPNGENVDIAASYHSGVKMDQSAGWLGLNWDYNPGEITRSQMGINDDNNANEIQNTTYERIANQQYVSGHNYVKYYMINQFGYPFEAYNSANESLYTFYSYPDGSIISPACDCCVENIGGGNYRVFKYVYNSLQDAKVVTDTKITQEHSFMRGPLYFKNFTSDWTSYQSAYTYVSDQAVGCKYYPNPVDQYSLNYNRYGMDVHSSNYKSTSTYILPDYDNFIVSGPGISGSIRSYIFEKASLVPPTRSRKELYSANGIDRNVTVVPSLESPYYSYPTGKQFSTNRVEFAFAKETGKYIGDEYTGTASSLNATNSRIISGNYVKYYTNAEINTSTNVYDNTTHEGLLDYQSANTGTNRRNTTIYPADAIGAFEITTPQGLTYHYSLATYNDKETSFSIPLKTSTSNVNAFLDITSVGTKVMKSEKKYKYASSWKLTAITGRDYNDVNGNAVADQGDEGYWVAYNYSLWNSTFSWAFPFYNYKTDFGINSVPYHYQTGVVGYFLNNDAQSYTPIVDQVYPDAYKPKYSPVGNIYSGQSEMYYLNSIQTATHTAFFVKDARLDGYSKGTSKIPLLKISRIILLRNEDASVLSSAPGSLSIDGRLSTSGCNFTGLIHEGMYQANKTAIDQKSLQSVEFTYDYSLCPKLYNNINNTYASSALNYTYTSYPAGSTFQQYTVPICDMINSPLSYSTSDASNSGKLTLKKIVFYGDKHVKLSPSTYDFAYSSNNPDYNPDKVDNWGYYKSDFQTNLSENYTTFTSKSYLDVWSLNQITTPSGAVISVVYESDDFELVAEDGRNNFTKPAKIFKPYKLELGGMSPPYNTYYMHFLSGTFQDEAFGNTTNAYSVKKINAVVPYNTNSFSAWNNGYRQWTVSYKIDKTSTVPTSTSELWGNPLMPISTYSQTFSSGTYTFTRVNLIGGATSGTDRYKLFTQNNTALPTQVITSSNVSSAPVNINSDDGFLYFEYDKLYGGGTRVQQITVKENTAATDVYTQKFSYTTGIATSVPDKYIRPQSSDFYLQPAIAGAERFMLAPFVGYSKIISQTVTTDGRNNGTTEMEFVNCFEPSVEVGGTMWVRNANYSKPLKSTLYDKNGTAVSMSKSDYNPVDIVSGTIMNVGSIQETFNVSEFINGAYVNRSINKIEYAGDVTKQSSFKDGIEASSMILERDMVTGMPIKTAAFDATKGVTYTETTLAYTDPAYPQMGPKALSTGPNSKLNYVMAVSKQKTYLQKPSRDAYHNLVVNKAAPGILIGGSTTNYTNTIVSRSYNTGVNSYQSTATTSANLWIPGTTKIFNGVTDEVSWKVASQPTLLNKRNATLESVNNARKSSVKYGHNSSMKLTEISDAGYNSFSFTSFEDKINVNPSGTAVYHFGGEINGGQFQLAATTAMPAHTGDYLAKIPANTFGPSFTAVGFEVGRTYRASVWLNKNSTTNVSLCAALDGSINGVPTYLWKSTAITDANNITVGDWILVNVEITVPDTYVASGGPNNLNNLEFFIWNNGSNGDVFADDFNIRPNDAPIKGYVYDSRTNRVNATLDAENFATFFKYDALGRLLSTQKETISGIKKISENTYHYARP